MTQLNKSINVKLQLSIVLRDEKKLITEGGPLFGRLSRANSKNVNTLFSPKINTTANRLD